MKLIKLTANQLAKVLQDLDAYRDKLYLDASELSNEKLDFIGEVRDYINTAGGTHIRDVGRWIQDVEDANSDELKIIKTVYLKGTAVTTGAAIDRFETWCRDMHNYGRSGTKDGRHWVITDLDKVFELIHSPTMHQDVANTILEVLIVYDSHVFLSIRERTEYIDGNGKVREQYGWSYENWANMAQSLIDKILRAHENCEERLRRETERNRN